jgi:anti-sigma factor RsiW
MDNGAHQAFDAAIRAKLRESPVPVGLKTRILATATPVRRVPLSAWLAAAAALLFVAVAGWFWLRPTGFGAYRAEMAKFVSVAYKLDVQSGDLDDLRQAAARAGSPFPAALLPALAKLPLEGGCLLEWRGRKVTLVCMETQDHDVWLFITEAMADAPAQPVFARSGRITTASWTDDGLTYVLATEGDEAELRSYL